MTTYDIGGFKVETGEGRCFKCQKPLGTLTSFTDKLSKNGLVLLVCRKCHDKL